MVLCFTYLNAWTFLVITALGLTNLSLELVLNANLSKNDLLIRGLRSIFCSRLDEVSFPTILASHALWILPITTCFLTIHDVVSINYEQKSTLNHLEANLVLGSAVWSGLSAFVMACFVTHNLNKNTNEKAVIFSWIWLLITLIMFFGAYWTMDRGKDWFYLTYYDDTNSTISIRVSTTFGRGLIFNGCSPAWKA